MNQQHAFDIAELTRRLANLVRIGTVETVDYPAKKVRVRVGKILTGWITWGTDSAEGDLDWSPYETGEQVMMLAPNGELATAVVICALNRDAAPPPKDAAHVHYRKFKDGAEIEYNRNSHTLRVEGVANVHIIGTNETKVVCKTARVEASDSVTLQTPETTCTGNLTVDGDHRVKGDTKVDGNVDCDKTVKAKVDCISGTVSGKLHIHMPGGRKRTGPPKP